VNKILCSNRSLLKLDDDDGNTGSRRSPSWVAGF
jgi:hypothetical protein